MRKLVAAAGIALALAPAAAAKLRIEIAAPRATAVGRAVAVTIRAERPLDYDLRLIAVAPGRSVFDVVGRVTGDASRARASIPRDGFGVAVKRVGPSSWRGTVRFPSRGRWRLLVPNGSPFGFTLPPPALEVVVVRRPSPLPRPTAGT